MTRFFVKIWIIYSVEAHICIIQERTRKTVPPYPLAQAGSYPVVQAGLYPVAQAVLEVLNIVITGIHHDVSLENWFLVYLADLYKFCVDIPAPLQALESSLKALWWEKS